MRRFLAYFTILASLCASCAPYCRDTSLYQHSGRQKAIVAVLPVIESSNQMDLSWDVSREFTDEMRKRVYDSPTIYLLRDHGSREIAERLNTPNPSMIEMGEGKELGAAEFVVVTELLDQKESVRSPGEGGNSTLQLSMRVRLIDVRHETPKVILQEVLHNEHVIASAYARTDYAQVPWGTEAFQRTPLGLAHNKLVREIVARVESYIEAAR